MNLPQSGYKGASAPRGVSGRTWTVLSGSCGESDSGLQNGIKGKEGAHIDIMAGNNPADHSILELDNCEPRASNHIPNLISKLSCL